MMNQSQNPNDSLDTHLELAFRDRGTRRMQLKSDASPEKVEAYFCHHVVRAPQDLLVHVQRIHFAIERLPESRIYSALLDLFIALGERGLALRTEMLQQAKDHLSTEHLEYLNSILEGTATADGSIDDQSFSMLAKGVTGCRDMVRGERQMRDESPLEQALECIECSDLEGARLILEAAVTEDHAHPEQQKLLLELYRKTDDRKHFSVLYQAMISESNPTHAEWQALHQHFEQGS